MTFLGVPPALDWPIQFCVFTTAATYVASLVTGNVSQVDRLWTFLPTLYTAYYALLPLWPEQQPFFAAPYTPASLDRRVATTFSPRAVLILALVVLWMYRLTYNTYRRGLFSLKDEDYRWVVLRKQMPPWFFQVTNLAFISGIQNILLLLLGHPARVAATLQPHTPLIPSDFALALLALAVLAVEFTADNQQFAFQTYKQSVHATEKGKKATYDASKQWPGARLAWTPDDANRGFVTKGLWRYSRHPNFACEQTFWWLITFIPIFAQYLPSLPRFSEIAAFREMILAASHPSLHFSLVKKLVIMFLPALISLIPAIALSALFISSTLFTESVSASKYPKSYKAYQARVGMFGPLRTFEKWVVFTVFVDSGKQREIERLVWGDPQGGKGEKQD